MGRRVIERCAACDNCVALEMPQVNTLPDEREQLMDVLRCVSSLSRGRVSLVYILRGDDQAPPNALRNHPAWGALAFRSETAVERMLERLESAGLLRARVLEHGGAVLDLTPAGQAALDERIQPLT